MRTQEQKNYFCACSVGNEIREAVWGIRSCLHSFFSVCESIRNAATAGENEPKTALFGECSSSQAFTKTLVKTSSKTARVKNAENSRGNFPQFGHLGMCRLTLDGEIRSCLHSFFSVCESIRNAATAGENEPKTALFGECSSSQAFTKTLVKTSSKFARGDFPRRGGASILIRQSRHCAIIWNAPQETGAMA